MPALPPGWRASSADGRPADAQTLKGLVPRADSNGRQVSKRPIGSFGGPHMHLHPGGPRAAFTVYRWSAVAVGR